MLMKQCREDNKKLIISTHHMGLFSILQDWVRKAENKKYFSPEKLEYNTLTLIRKYADSKDPNILKKVEDIEIIKKELVIPILFLKYYLILLLNLLFLTF